jgi:hypothetical protein
MVEKEFSDNLGWGEGKKEMQETTYRVIGLVPKIL